MNTQSANTFEFPPELSLALVLPQRRLWAWHRQLITLLRQRANVTVFAIPGPGYAWWLDAWFRIEARIFRPVRARRLATLEAVNGRPGLADFDLIVDLSEAPFTHPGALTLHYEGLPDSQLLVGSLLRQRCPHLSVVRDGEVVTASYAAVPSGPLGGALDVIFARTQALVERAIDRCGAKSDLLPELPAPHAEQPSPAGLVALAGRVAANSLAKRLRRRQLRTEHWTIAWRRTRQGSAVPRDSDGFTISPIYPGGFIADPFVISRDGVTHVFAEVYSYATRKGVIGRATISDDGLSSFTTTLEREYHLSYPYLFEYRDELFMIPETAKANAVELYRCAAFPGEWTLDRQLMSDVRLKDVTVFAHDGLWWMLAAVPTHGGSSLDELFGWYADSPFGPWIPHPLNPLKSDARAARPAGRPIFHDGKVYRPAQDCETSYGAGLVWCELLELTPNAFAERIVAKWRGDDFGAYTGVHTYNRDDHFEIVDLKQTLRI